MCPDVLDHRGTCRDDIVSGSIRGFSMNRQQCVSFTRMFRTSKSLFFVLFCLFVCLFVCCFIPFVFRSNTDHLASISGQVDRILNCTCM